MCVCLFVYVCDLMPSLKMCSPLHGQNQYLILGVKPTEEIVSSPSKKVRDLQHYQIQLCSLTHKAAQGTYLHIFFFLSCKKTFSSICNFGCQGSVTEITPTECIHTPRHENCEMNLNWSSPFQCMNRGIKIVKMHLLHLYLTCYDLC